MISEHDYVNKEYQEDVVDSMRVTVRVCKPIGTWCEVTVDDDDNQRIVLRSAKQVEILHKLLGQLLEVDK